MSLTTTIIMLVCGWLAVAAAMLWGVLRITRRHHHPRIQPATPAKTEKPAGRTATAH